ncbi:hypothetical protein E2605_07730 [Dysgonomonas capnocytophagoides]|uniref:Uncharacterized protein n=1 Tax=Dysgonomonas capnocytophagoides TaxID=45254 RepID=A0A4Y8L365_9BACT|nr:hypothetical protein [Dysgonomonas capnocytophagoides]TFD96701.1 hypothetical protein E2605_07730 [Dysgonomonas capnocytophagoides]
MSKLNIFQGNKLLNKTVCRALGYEETEENVTYGWFTENIYTNAFFYLTKRFGNCDIYDGYKDGGIWNFYVKDYTIRIYLNSSWVSFIVFGKIGNMDVNSPYLTKYRREWRRKENQLINTFKQDGEGWTRKERPIIEKLYNSFLEEKGVDEKSITQQEWNDKYSYDWYECIEEYNRQVIGIDHTEILNKYGDSYQSAYTRHALRTLDQFIKNMLVPTWIRDVPYNIKGVITDKEARSNSRYENNIKIEFIKSTSHE